MLGKPRILSLFPNSFNKFNKTWALIEDPPFLLLFYFKIRQWYIVAPITHVIVPIDPGVINNITLAKPYMGTANFKSRESEIQADVKFMQSAVKQDKN